MQLDKVRVILRYQGHEQLASLMNHASVALEYHDEGTTIPGGFDVQLFTANISAPIDDCMALRNLSASDTAIILSAMQEVGMDRYQIIYDFYFSVDLETLGDSTPWSPTGWEHIDHELRDIEKELGDSTAARDFQKVALACRELLISLAHTVFDRRLHPKLDVNDEETRDADVKGMLERYCSSELPGSNNERYRRMARNLATNTWDVVAATLHDRNANFRRALLCVEASKLLISVVAIVSGRRDRVIADVDDTQSS